MQLLCNANDLGSLRCHRPLLLLSSTVFLWDLIGRRQGFCQRTAVWDMLPMRR